MTDPFNELNDRLLNIESLLMNLQAKELPDNSNKAKEKPITQKELCDYLNLSEPTLLRWRKKGKIPFFTIGTAIRFNLSEVMKSLGKQ